MGAPRGCGTWTPWLTNTTTTGGLYDGAVVGETVFFRSVARDALGHVETAVPPEGDSHTTVVARQAAGRVTNSRGEPVYNALVRTHGDLDVLNVGRTDLQGNYAVYFGPDGDRFLDLTVERSGFGALPLRSNVDSMAAVPDMDFVLPPAIDTVSNGGFETGDFTGWGCRSQTHSSPPPSSLPRRTAAWQVCASIPRRPPRPSRPMACARRWSCADVPAPTLSLLYRVVSGNPADMLAVEVRLGQHHGARGTPHLAPGGWTHLWLDLSMFRDQTVTVRFGLRAARPPARSRWMRSAWAASSRAATCCMCRR